MRLSFFVLLLPSLATVCDSYPGLKLLCVLPTNYLQYWVEIKG